MKYNDLSNLLLKITGLLIFLFSVINLPNYFVNYYSLQNFYGNQLGDITTIVVAVAIPLAITLLVALALYMFPSSITNSLIFNKNEEYEINIENLPSVVFMGIGMYFVAFSLADTVYWFAYYIFMEQSVPGSEFFAAENKARVVATIVELTIGLILLFGAKGIGIFINKARAAGIEPSSNN